MLKDFKAFILRGNVVDLAIGVVIGAAFAGIVTAFTAGVITPLLAAAGGGGNFAGYAWKIGNLKIGYGLVITAVINFLIMAAVIFFLVVVPVNKLMAARKTAPDAESTTKDCPECLSSIPVAAKRCAFCAIKV